MKAGNRFKSNSERRLGQEQTRRKFLGSVASGGAGVLAAGSVLGAQSQEQTKLDRYNDQTTLQNADPQGFMYAGEELANDEMRITLMGTSYFPRPQQQGPSIFVELGNGDSFVFDVGPGCSSNYHAMRVPYSRTEKIFLSHLHMDHVADLPYIYGFGPDGDRYSSLKVYGPSGIRPEFGTESCIRSLETLLKWHTTSFRCAFDTKDSYKLDIHEFDYKKNPGVAYESNGVKISHFPVAHSMDGGVGYRLDWNGLSMGYSGDTNPTTSLVENCKGVDILLHETTGVDATTWSEKNGLPLAVAQRIIENSHTVARAMGKVLELTQPKLGVTVHSEHNPDLLTPMVDGIRTHYDGPYVWGRDLMVFNVSQEGIKQRMGVGGNLPWYAYGAPKVIDPPPLDINDYKTKFTMDLRIMDY